MDELINQIIDDIYEAAIDHSHIPVMLDKLCKLVSAHQAMTIFFTDIHYGAYTTIKNSDVLSLYNTEYKDQDYWQEEIIKRKLHNTVITGHELKPTREFINTDYYHDIMIPGDIFDCLGIAFKGSSPLHSAFVVHRSIQDEIFGEYEKRLLAKVTPHLNRLGKLMEKFNFLSLANRFCEETLNQLSFGVVILDGENKIHFHNKATEDIFIRNDGLHVHQGRLMAELKNDSVNLSEIISRANGKQRHQLSSIGNECIIQRGTHKKPYIVNVLPLNLQHRNHPVLPIQNARCVLVIITDPDIEAKPSIQVLDQLFGLTQTETSFAIHLSEGKSVKDIAEYFHISEGTARWHLKNIQAKTDSHKQSDIVRLINKISPNIRNMS